MRHVLGKVAWAAAKGEEGAVHLHSATTCGVIWAWRAFSTLVRRVLGSRLKFAHPTSTAVQREKIAASTDEQRRRCVEATSPNPPCSVNSTLKRRIPKSHPLCKFRVVVDTILASKAAELDALYAPMGRDSIPPERLQRASLIQTLFSSRSERQLVTHIDYNLL
ncbi:MAG: transposase [Aquimonas sp.]|nr:transposase [Aquimonas sp.]